MSDDMAVQALLSRLGRGQDHAKHKAQLADELGWTEREVKRAVHDARLDGFLVLSGNDGYWLDGSPQEWLARQRSQIHSMWRTYRAVRRTYRTQGTEQVAIWE
jgi:biotin operon repressor